MQNIYRKIIIIEIDIHEHRPHMSERHYFVKYLGHYYTSVLIGSTDDGDRDGRDKKQ